MREQHKKESPILSLLGLGGGGTGLSLSGASGYPSDSFWISEAARGSWGNEGTYDIAGDNEGNIYVGGQRSNAGGSGLTGASIVKYAVDGTVSWQKVEYYSTSGGIGENTQIIAEADGDHIYFISETANGACIHKMNKSDGTSNWRRLLGQGNSNDKATSLVMRSDGNVNCMIRMDTDSGRSAYFNINESNGAYVWQTSVKRTSGDTTDSQTTMHMKVDSSDNIHSLVWADKGGTPRYHNAIVKHNSSGVLQSISDYYTSYANEDYFGDIAVDSSGNKYISYRYITGSGQQMRVGVMKVNSSDAIQWQKGIDSAPNYISPEQIEVLPDDAGIIMRIDDRQNQGDSGDGKSTFVRFDTSGNVVWKRQFGITNPSGIDVQGSAGKMRLNRNGNIIFSTYINTGGQIYIVVAQLPADGSLTGSHTVGSRTYEWAANTRLSFSTQTAWNKTSTIFSSETNSDSNAPHTNVILANNVQTFTKGDVD